MTLADSSIRDSYSGDGATTAFSVTFDFWDQDDLKVIHVDANDTETTWTRGTQYTVSGGNGSTGTVTVETTPTDYTPASGERLVIKSNLSDTQNTDLPLGGEFPSTSVEQQMDKIVRLVQQQAEEIGRSIVFSEGSESTQQTLPEPSDQKVLGWNGTTLANLTPNSDTYLTTPGSATDNALVRFNGTSGESFQNGQTTEDDNGNLTLAGALTEPTFIDVASATTTDIGAENGRNIRITGTTTITGLGTVAAGTIRKVRFAAALTLTHNGTSLILPGSANITTAADDTAEFISLGSGNWLCNWYKKADGTSVVTTQVSQATQANIEAETDEDTYIPPDLLQHNPRVPAVLASWDGTGTAALNGNNDVNVSSLTDSGTGDFTVNYTTSVSAAPYPVYCTTGGDSNEGDTAIPEQAAGVQTGALIVRTDNQTPSASDFDYNAAAAWGDFA